MTLRELLFVLAAVVTSSIIGFGFGEGYGDAASILIFIIGFGLVSGSIATEPRLHQSPHPLLGVLIGALAGVGVWYEPFFRHRGGL